MKRCISLLLVVIIFLTGCSPSKSNEISVASSTAISDTKVKVEDIVTDPENGVVADEGEYEEWSLEENFGRLDSNDLLNNIEDTVYSSLIDDLDGKDYYIENVEATYVSKEYIEELSYNSKTNIFFGYTLAELDKEFQRTRYVFTLDDDGETTVKAFESYDDTYEKVLKNVAIGTGVILVCVTVSAVTAGTAPAISMIFAVSAKTGTIAALSGSAIGGVSAGFIDGIQTGNVEHALKATALGASEGYKMGAICGSIYGGAGEALALKGAAANGLTMNEAAIIQKESKYPLDVIKQFRNTQEYKVYKDAGLSTEMINGRTALTQDIDLESVVDNAGRTNVERINKGLSPVDPATGHAYELHHIGQKPDSTIAVLTREQHDLPGLHGESFGVDHGTDWKEIVHKFWESYIKARGY